MKEYVIKNEDSPDKSENNHSISDNNISKSDNDLSKLSSTFLLNNQINFAVPHNDFDPYGESNGMHLTDTLYPPFQNHLTLENGIEQM